MALSNIPQVDGGMKILTGIWTENCGGRRYAMCGGFKVEWDWRNRRWFYVDTGQWVRNYVEASDEEGARIH